jgi:enoyl-CoA hydratase/carnithine racemase
MSTVNLQRRGPIGLVTLNRAERLNAISRTLTRDLHEALVEANRDSEIKTIVWNGEGRAFCAGDDLKEFDLQTESPEAIKDHIDGIQQITKDLMFSDKIVIGAIHGFAVGGGFEWLLNCDFVVAAENLICFFPETEWGQFLTGAVTQLLPQSVGYQRAMELMVLGERQSARDLLNLGVVNRVEPQERMLDTAFELAERTAAKSQFSVSRLKRLMNQQLSGQIAKAIGLETEVTIAAFKMPEAAERVRQFANRKRDGKS